MKPLRFIVAVVAFPFFVGGLLSAIAWAFGENTSPSYSLWMLAVLWAVLVHAARDELETSKDKLVRLLAFKSERLDSPIRWRGNYFLCKLGRSVLPVPYELFKGFEASLLVGADKVEYERLGKATRSAPSRRHFVRDANALVRLEQKLCLSIGLFFLEHPGA